MKLHLGDLAISSPAFGHGDRLADEFTAEGADVSPELRWTGVPDGTRELVLICHDPDAPLTDGFTHWVVKGIPPDATGIPKGGGSQFVEGVNDFGNTGYNGPAPPPGHGRHHYFFHLYAVGEPAPDTPTTRSDVLRAIDDSIIEQARIVGTFDR